MRKADAVLLVLAAVVTVVTLAGVVASDSWTDERRFRFEASTQPLEPQTMPAATAPARFEWPAPDNATAAVLNVTITFAGQAVQGGSATVRVSGTAPDGTPLPVKTVALPVAAGATAATIDIPYNATWLALPDDVTDTREPPATRWDAPFVLLVSVDSPSDLPVASYAYTASATGAFVVYGVR